ncbi:non-hydrolyzing UDP-N-acetylglucosamine 2-epimerase [Arcanobacterium hippocoleae]|uniref:UDP-N-acetylglucosamine 2-epimerase (non-hydrolyzing) n=1 Tax=Arcanobacterium hippocoleae TaxID=149017 RepID=A0ABU1T152_9ACTO|nr:UDP-N-acetylglucosamine 2-epimerase (non-hydrolyzing) [Arcanobacterium hippocoleae]MDR6938581.1 UDP-N-acetylglucosamine 2-epimerase (non-hydrolyzing) [Arcanobacterium hippocoleae]
MKVLSVFGTRPEAIKMCPLVLELQKTHGIESLVCVTGQHRSMLDQVLEIFGVTPDYDLAIMKPRQTITSITTAVLEKLPEVLDECKPDIVLVHGDTTTSMAAAMAAFYNMIPVGHVEAGLRTYDRYSPFPEEMNRKLISSLANVFFAPTAGNQAALAKEAITDNVYVTGNTVIDAFQYTVKENYVFKNEQLKAHDFTQPTILLTAHRRENLGKPLAQICDAIIEICRTFPQVRVIYPVHLNPAVRDTVWEKLADNPQITLTDPVDVQDMHNAMARAKLVMTDSGGLQEEAPHLGKPVIVLRTETERPEAVTAGTAVVAGVGTRKIADIAATLLADETAYEKMSKAINPYGDGHASERIAQILLASHQDNAAS